MKLVLYALHPPRNYIKKSKQFGHTIYQLKNNQVIVPEKFSTSSINPQNFTSLKKVFNIGSIMILDRLMYKNESVCIVDHVNLSGFNFLLARTPFEARPTFPDMSNIYNEVSGLKGVVVHTVGPGRFKGLEQSRLLISESVGLVSPVWHYIGVRVFAKNDYQEKLR